MSGTHLREPSEVIARALCKHAGHAPDTRFEGRPMWESFIPEAMAALIALQSSGYVVIEK
jgi:hypothetical protein